VFQSSASESGNEAPSLQQVTTDKAVAGPSEVTMTKPKQHIVFQSSASESGNEAPSLQQVTTDKAVAGPSKGRGGNEGDKKEEVDEDDDDDEEEEDDKRRVDRSSYVNQGNVQEVRAARKRAGLSEGFPRSDPCSSNSPTLCKSLAAQA